MNYGGNMPDWHQYNSTQPIGSEVPSNGQNVNQSPIFGPTISPRRLNGPAYSPDGLNKPQNEASYNPRSFQQSPNTLNGPNVPPENSPMGASAQIPGSHVHYGAPSPRNSMIEGANPPLDSRTVPGSLSEAINQRNQQLSMSRPAGQLNCPTTINGSMGPMAQRNAPTNIQPSIPASNRQGPGTYVPCKGLCCNPDTTISYQSWEKFGPYSPNVPYRDTGYPVDNRRFGNEFENREQLGTSGVYAVDPRRNFADYKYRKDPIIPRPYPHPSGVIQNYPVQNYNFPADYQKYPGYPVKEYPRENPIANTQNPAILKYQEQSVIVQQKYFTKPVQYQNGVIPKNIVPTSMGGNVLSRPQDSYFNPQLARNFPRGYSESTAIPNRRIRSTDPIHTSYPEYPMYQQKIAMQRYTMENQLRDLTRIPGYQSHPKYQESVLRYRELLRLQQNVDYQSTVQDAPKTLTSQGGEDIPPINLQFDQNGVLINTNFQPAGYSSNLQSPINVQNSKTVQSVSSAEVRPLNLQQPERFRVQAAFDNRRQDHMQNQVPPSLPQPELSRETEQRYPLQSHQPQVQKYEGETLNLSNSDDSKTPSVEKRDSKDFADKPELDVRQFLATWDESEDEDGANANLPDVVLSNSTPGAVPEHENTTAVSGSAEEAKNCSESEDCRSRDDCGVFDNTQNVTKPCNSSDNQTYRSDLRPSVVSTESRELDLSTSNPGRQPIRTGTVIQSTSIDCSNETPIHKLENFTNSQATNVPCRVTKSLNNNESQESSATVEADVIVKKESPVEEETLTSIKKHIEAYEHEAKTEIRSSVEDVIENGEDSRSCCGKESSENIKDQFDSEDDLSESSDSDSMSSDSMSSFVKSPKTIHGTEIHVNAQELSANPASPKNHSEMVESPNLQKQSSFASEESHNPDDISLPDLPTSECTPISTALNTPIHSDSEESSDPVIDLTTPANPIEIIQNSPMLSFTHSPIKMEPYEHLDENDSTDKTSHFEFQTSNSCDNDYGRLTDVSSHTTEQFNVAQNDEDTFDSDCIEILSEKAEQQRNEHEIETKNDVTDDIADGKPFAFNNATVMATDTTNNATVDADRKPWPSVSAMEHDTKLSNSTEHEGVNTMTEKSEIPSEMDKRLSLRSEDAEEDQSNDHMAHLSSTKNYHSTSRWLAECESTENLTALNLVKDENKMINEPENLQIVPEECRYQTDRTDDEECRSTIENQVPPTATEHTDRYSSSSGEDNVYSETEEDRSRFPGTSNIPLIPGEDFEEPKMPVLPMEGNCLTKILKNTSPITDLDVLGSDDEKLDKMDEIWMEVGGVDTVGKTSGANTDAHTDCGEGFNREKSSRNRLRMFHKTEKRVKHLAEAKDTGESIGQGWNESKEKKLRNDTNWQEYKANIAQKETNPIDRDFQGAIVSGTDDIAAMTQDKRSYSKATIFSNTTSNSNCREDSNPSNDICSETTTATEIMKCKEKANHINDIATKLLENARLCEPEQTNESSPVEEGRDSSKKRIKSLKEFRKIKNKVKVDKPEDESVKSEDGVENQAADLVNITDQYKKTNVKAANEKEIDSILQVPDTLIESMSPRLKNVNTDEYTSDLVSADVRMLEEKLPQTSNGDEETIEGKNTARKNDDNVNMEGSITVENNSCINSHEILNTKAVVPIERNDINESAINLSKSSNDFDSSNTTLDSKGCVINDSQDSNVSENDEPRVPADTRSEINEETICAETKDQTASPPRSPSTGDNASRSEVEEAADTSLEAKPVEDENVTESNCESNSSPRSTNFAEEYVLNENDEQEKDQQASNTDHVAPKESSSSPEKGEDLPLRSSENPKENLDNIYENCNKSPDIFEPNDAEVINTPVFEQSEDLNSHGPPAVDNAENRKSADGTSNSEKPCDADNLQHDVVDEPTAEEEETNQLTGSFHDDAGKSFFNPPADHGMAIQSVENLLSKSSAEFMDNSSNHTSVPETKEDTGGLLLVEAESKIIIDVEKTSQDLDFTLDIHEELMTVPKDSEGIEIHSILNDFPIESQSREPRGTESLNLTSELVPGTDGSTSTAGATMATFESEDPFNCDFNNFDVAPNINESTTADESNSWKYSKAYARFEDCERYKNPDNFVDPILTSLESLDNLNTVPVYTTKDGKITYSPNPKFTYRALIMEAREREGYPSMRESRYGNPRTQESSHSSKSQTSVRKRKNSEGHGYSSGSYSKKNYMENYKPREHGESSMKKSPESWNKNCFGHDKYSRQSRDRSSHSFTPHNGDVEKKYSAEKILQERVSRNYKQREEGHAVFDERYRKKNGTSDRLKSNNRTQFRQSKEQSTSDSVWSTSKRDVKGDQKTSTITQPRSESGKTNDIKKIKTSRSSSSTEKRSNNDNQGHESDNTTEKSMPFPDEKKLENQFTSDIPLPKPEQSLSSDKQSAKRKSIDLEVREIKTVSSTSHDQPLIEQNLIEISHNESNGGGSPSKLRFSSPKWEETCENSFLLQENILELKESAKSWLNEVEENKLYERVDDIRENRTSVLHETDTIDHSEIQPKNSVEAATENERIEDTDCIQEKCNIEEDESILSNGVQKDEIPSLSPDLNGIDERIDDQEIPESPKTPNENEPATSLVEEIESTQDEEKPAETLPCTDNQIIEDLEKENGENEIASSIHIGDEVEVEAKTAATELNELVQHSSGESISSEDSAKTERREAKLKSHKIKSEIKSGTSAKNIQPSTTDDENPSKPQAQLDNYISYSPVNESADDTRAIPKLVIKKTDSLNCKNIGLGPLSTAANDLFAERVLDKDDQGSRSTGHPKIPKILIRNAKSRPTTPSIEEITEETSFSVTTKEETKVPKVKIRFEDKRSRSPPSIEINSKTDFTESKIPKMKIKLEDRLPKVFIENVNKESCRSNDVVQKTIPKMKIKKCKGALRHIADTQILPVSIPRMFIYTELEGVKETSSQTLTKNESNTMVKNCKTVVPSSGQEEEKTTESDVKKIPKLKIKRQSSGCSIELNRKRHSLSPVQSELKKVRKSLKAIETNDKKQSSKTSSGLEHQESQIKVDTFSIEESYEVTSFENVTATDQPQASESIKHEETTSKREATGTPQEIPKVIIKRASPTAEFKCELSKGKTDAIIRNKRWQPEVKLQRSWVLDCMAKDLNLEKLTLKLATPGSILKKCLTEKKPELGKSHAKNGSVNTDENTKKLFRSKSASELIFAQRGSEMLATNNVGFVTHKRCKSDLGSRFLTYSGNLESKKKIRNDNHSTLDSEMEKEDRPDTIINSTGLNTQRNYNEGVNFMETSARSPLDENMNSKKAIPAPTINLDASDRHLLNSDLNTKTSTSMENRSKSECECFENSKEFTDNSMIDSEHRKTPDVSKDSAITWNGNFETVVGQKFTEEIRRDSCIEFDDRNRYTADKSVEDNGASSTRNVSVNYTEEDRTAELAAMLMGSHDQAESVIVDTGIPGESVVLQTANSVNPDILRTKPELTCADAAKAVDHLQTDNTYRSDINDNSDSKVRELETSNAVREKLESYINAAERRNTSELNENVLIENTEANIGINSITRMEYSKESQSIIEMLSDSPNRETEIQTGPTSIEENGICLYHEDAIPTQFELELEVMDNTESDLEVPIPQDDYSGDETNEPFNISRNRVVINPKSETTLPEEDEAITQLGERGAPSSKETEKRKTIFDSRVKTTDIKKSLNCSDLLVKEVLAAKEMLKKCLARSKNGSRIKPKARPKTAAEKKQGSSFDFSRLAAAVSEDRFNKLDNRSSIDITTGANCSRQFDEESASGNSNEKLCQNQSETEYKVNKIESDKKHSKSGKSSLMIKKKYSSLPKNVDKLTNPTRIEEYLIPTNILTDTKDSVEYMKLGETSVSIKNSKLLIKTSSHSDAKKKIPELTNSKDSKSRTNNKSSRHDVNSKYAGKSKSGAQNIAPRESSLDIVQSNEKSVSDAAKQKYKSSKTSSDQNVNSTAERTKFKLYKIPKIGKPDHEELQKSRTKEARMPVLEPQVDLNSGIEASELSSDREISRSPPLITNQESTQSLKHQILTNEDLAKQRTTFPDAPEATPLNFDERTVADIVNNMAYHEKATIRHRRYCTLCERWFPTVARHRRHLSGYQHRHTELTQRRTIHALFTLFTGKPCPRLQPPGVVRIDCEPGELTPLQIAVQGVTQESSEADDANITKPSREDK